MARRPNPTVPRFEYIAERYPMTVLNSVILGWAQATGRHDVEHSANRWMSAFRGGVGTNAEYMNEVVYPAIDGSSRFDRYLPTFAQLMNRRHKRWSKLTDASYGTKGATWDQRRDLFAEPGSPRYLFDFGEATPEAQQIHSDQLRETLRLYALEQFVRNKMRAVVDYLEASNVDVARLKSYEDIEKLMEDVDAHAEAQLLEAPVPGTVVFRFPDGWTVQALDEQEQLEYEGAVMQHCVGGYDVDSQFRVYDPYTSNSEVRIFSLRDPQGRPHATLEWDEEDATVRQLRGKQNDAPRADYLQRMIDFRREWIDQQDWSQFLQVVPVAPPEGADLVFREDLLGAFQFPQWEPDETYLVYDHGGAWGHLASGAAGKAAFNIATLGKSLEKDARPFAIHTRSGFRELPPGSAWVLWAYHGLKPLTQKADEMMVHVYNTFPREAPAPTRPSYQPRMNPERRTALKRKLMR